MAASGLWIFSAENGALPGGKVGGVGDVIRDLPPALARRGWRPRVVTPAYGRLHRVEGARRHRELEVGFAGERHIVQVYGLPAEVEGVAPFVLAHPLFTPNGDTRIYCPDPPDHPYETDSIKFAFFCATIAAWVEQSEAPPDILHLHDWHTGLVPLLRSGGRAGPALAAARCVFTIHNIAYQGVRPFAGGPAALDSWFPGWDLDRDAARDPRYPDCVNFMAAAVRLSEAVNTVSPTYAREIQEPSDPATGFFGGEGLEEDLRRAAAEGRLHGILNGCAYPPRRAAGTWPETLALVGEHRSLLGNSGHARERLERLAGRRPATVLLNIGRTAGQKVSLLLEPAGGRDTALEAILEVLEDDGIFLMLGSGEAGLEARLAALAARHERFIYLRGYAERLSDPLYEACDLFIMPSSFEPCGISQMLAMRAGAPCVVHGVGGLQDTVEDGETGFVFHGRDPVQQAEALVKATDRALRLKAEEPEAWRALCARAAEQRFDWNLAAADYARLLYGCEPQAHER